MCRNRYSAGTGYEGRKYNLPRGVRFHITRPKPYRAVIDHEKKRYHLGWYDTPEEASAAYEAALEMILAGEWES
jgi:AP2 domain